MPRFSCRENPAGNCGAGISLMAEIKIAANIMDSDLTRIADQVGQLEEAGADLLHMDIMDGHYVPAFVGGPRMLAAIKRVAKIPVDVHLMVSNPDTAVDWFLDAGADIVMFHHEAADDPADVIKRIKQAGARAGTALRPEMEADSIRRLAGELDCVIAMTVQPGKSGQSFMEPGCHKIPDIRRMCGDNIDIYVDGGMNGSTISIAARYGANVFATASAVFRSGRPFSEVIPELRAAAEKGRSLQV